MSKSLNRRYSDRQTGAERLRDGATDLGTDLLAFRQWSVSDLISNGHAEPSLLPQHAERPIDSLRSGATIVHDHQSP